MSKGASIHRLPQQVEPRKLAYNEARFNGFVELTDLPRLTESAHFTGDVAARIDFSVDEQKRRIVSGEIEATVALQCQRCLQLIEEQNIQAQVALAVVGDEDEARQLPRELDPWVVGGDEADFYTLIEEELLLNLPPVAYHDFACIDESLLSHGDSEAGEAKGENPFRVLANIKYPKSKD